MLDAFQESGACILSSRAEKRWAGHLVLVVLLCVAAYFDTFFMDFIWDDLTQIRDNPFIRSIENFPQLFVSSVDVGSGVPHVPYYRPLFNLSLMLDYFVWGGNARGMHVTNVMLHIGVVVTLYFVVLRLLNSTRTAFVSALIFAVHPVHAEAVSYISARGHTLCALFMLLSFHSYLLFRKKGMRWQLWWAIAFMVAAMFSNEMAVTLPAVILLYEICWGEGRLPERFRHPLSFWGIAVCYAVFRAIILGRNTWVDIPFEVRLGTGFGIIERYFDLLVMPFHFQVFYDMPLQRDFWSPAVLIPLGVLAAYLVAGLLCWKRHRIAFFGIFFTFITVIPVSDIPAVIYPALMADRYLYVPSIGFCLAAGYGAIVLKNWLREWNVFGRYRTVVFAAHAALLLIVCGYTEYRNAMYWDNETFWLRAVADAPGSAYARFNLGLAYENAKKLNLAVKEFETVFMKEPIDDVRDRLFVVYYKQGMSAFDSWYRIGRMYMEKSMLSGAEKAFEEALRYNSKSAETHNALGIIYEEEGNHAEAIRHFKAAVSLHPDDAGYRRNLDHAIHQRLPGRS